MFYGEEERGMEVVTKKFRELTLDELYEILSIRAEIFVVEQGCPYNDVDGKDKIAVHILMKEKERVVAYCRVIPRGISYSESSIGRVLVIKEMREKGLAREIVKRGIEYITEVWNEDEITIGAQAYIEKFYSSLGFEPISQIYLEDGIPHLDMKFDKKKKESGETPFSK